MTQGPRASHVQLKRAAALARRLQRLRHGALMYTRKSVKECQMRGDLVAVPREVRLTQVLKPGERPVIHGGRDDQGRVFVGHRSAGRPGQPAAPSVSSSAVQSGMAARQPVDVAVVAAANHANDRRYRQAGLQNIGVAR